MGTLPQAIEVLSTRLNEPLPRTKQISRHLLDAGLLPKSAGKRIERLGAVHIATFILALSAAMRPAEASQAALTWGRMTPNGEPLRPAVAGEPPQFMLIEIIAGMIAYVWSEDGAGPMTDVVRRSTLEITTTPRAHAIVDFNGRREQYLPTGGEALSGRQRVDRIPGATIVQIAMALREGARIPPEIPVDAAAIRTAQDAQPTNFDRDHLPVGP
jgi:hypothetical protein